jgi:hypothetical protein
LTSLLLNSFIAEVADREYAQKKNSSTSKMAILIDMSTIIALAGKTEIAKSQLSEKKI